MSHFCFTHIHTTVFKYSAGTYQGGGNDGAQDTIILTVLSSL